MKKCIPALAAVLLLLAAVPAAAKDRWLNLRSKNFNVISNADEGDTRQLLLKLEQFRFVFSKLVKTQNMAPITVVVFKNDGSFKPFKPLYNGKPKNIGGYFQQGRDENLIALNIAASELRPLALIFHEYTHYLTSRMQRPLPLWLNEGVAELYSSFEVDKTKVTLGTPIDNHVFFLREKKFLPIRSLFTVRHGSVEYNERDKQGVFYAQSWALAHYLMFGDRMARQPQLIEFVNLLGAGVADEEAFTRAFKVTPEAMEKSLRDYIGRDSYTVVSLKMESTEGEKDITIKPLSEAESQYYLGNLLLRSDRLDEAENYFKQAMALDATLATPYEGMGFAAMRRDKYAEAEEFFRQATERGSKNHLAYYYYAEAQHRRALQNAAAVITPEAAAQMTKITEALRSSIKLAPDFAHSHALLAYVLLTGDANLDEGEQALKNAIRLEPQNRGFRLNLAQLQMRARKYDEAKKTLEPLAKSDDESARASAEAMTRVINQLSSRAAPSSAETHAVTSAGESSSAESPRLPAKEGAAGEAPLPPWPPGLAKTVAGAEKMVGVITAVECDGNSMVIALKNGDKVARFYVADHNRTPFFSRAVSFSVDIVCGPNKLPAVIYFKPSANAKVTGDAVAVEFTKQ